MAKLIKNTGNVFDGFGFGGVSVPERETFYDKSMNRLNSLVERDSTLQRLRDVSCQLMLADRQQEELVNYVNSFINNFEFNEGSRWKSGASPTSPSVWGNWDGFRVSSPAVKPIIKEVFPCQGAFSSLENVAGGQPVRFYGQFSLRSFVEHFNGNQIPPKAYWIGFVSDVYASGQVSVDGEPDAHMVFNEYLRPYTSANDDGTYSARFTKLTDTSPLVSKDGIIYVDLLNSAVVNSTCFQLQFGFYPSGFYFGDKALLLSPKFKFSFVFVGMGIVFG